MSCDFALRLRDCAAQTGPVCAAGFRVGGISVEISSSCPDMDVAVPPSLEAFRSGLEAPDILIETERVEELARCSSHQLFDSGCTWRLHEHELGYQFDFYVAALGVPHKRLIIDDCFSRGRLQISEAAVSRMAYSPPLLGYPLDELLIVHRLTQASAVELHGVGIVDAESANNLFVGHSGAGKSTTAWLWAELRDVKILSDDRIIVREDSNRISMYGTPWHGDGCFALPDHAPLHRIFILEHGHGNAITRLSKSQAVAELFARSFVPFHRHEYVDSALSFLEQVADSVPCYGYAFEPDQRAVEKILHFRD